MAARRCLAGLPARLRPRRRVDAADHPWRRPVRRLGFDRPERLRAEDEILDLFADLCAYSRRRPEPAEEETGERVRAPEEYLLTCLRTYDRRGDGLPAVFREQLFRVLRHYGLDDLGPSSDVAETLMRVYRSQQRLDGLVPAVAAILDRRLARIEELRTQRSTSCAASLITSSPRPTAATRASATSPETCGSGSSSSRSSSERRPSSPPRWSATSS